MLRPHSCDFKKLPVICFPQFFKEVMLEPVKSFCPINRAHPPPPLTLLIVLERTAIVN